MAKTTDSKRFKFSTTGTNGFAANAEMLKSAYALLNLHFDDENPNYPATVRDFVQWLIDLGLEYSEGDQGSRIRNLDKIILDKNAEIRQLEAQVAKDDQTIKDLQAKISELEETKNKTTEQISDPKRVLFDDDSFEILNLFMDAYRAADPEKSTAQAIADLITIIRSVKKATGGKIILDNKKELKF